jgi:hypothetical protein
VATVSVPALVNRESVGRAIAIAREECKEDKRWLNAVNRAALNLEACQWQFDGIVFIVKSTTEDIHYNVTPDGCECKAFLSGKPCWHRAARRLLLKAAELAMLPLPRDACPMCGKLIEAKAYTINGRPYMYWEVCDGNGEHIQAVIVEVAPPEFENA